MEHHPFFRTTALTVAAAYVTATGVIEARQCPLDEARRLVRPACSYFSVQLLDDGLDTASKILEAATSSTGSQITSLVVNGAFAGHWLGPFTM